MNSNFRRAITLILLLLSGFAYAAYDLSDVKAVYVFRIVNFIHWDNESEMSEVEFCVLGNREVAATLKSITQSKTIRQLPVLVSTQYRTECDIVYVDSNAVIDFKLSAPQTVMIGDGENIRHLGGTIELITMEGKVKPKIYLENVGEFSISASLLRIAIVEEEHKT